VGVSLQAESADARAAPAVGAWKKDDAAKGADGEEQFAAMRALTAKLDE
jgi:hypothetical protein